MIKQFDCLLSLTRVTPIQVNMNRTRFRLVRDIHFFFFFFKANTKIRFVTNDLSMPFARYNDESYNHFPCSLSLRVRISANHLSKRKIHMQGLIFQKRATVRRYSSQFRRKLNGNTMEIRTKMLVYDGYTRAKASGRVMVFLGKSNFQSFAKARMSRGCEKLARIVCQFSRQLGRLEVAGHIQGTGDPRSVNFRAIAQSTDKTAPFLVLSVLQFTDNIRPRCSATYKDNLDLRGVTECRE